jgi:hypothetical protein
MPAFIFDPIMSPPLPRILLSILQGDKRDFGEDARALVARLDPPLSVIEPPGPIPQNGMAVIANHYMGPDFKAWWLALAVSASLNVPVAWVVTREWGYQDVVRQATVTPVTRMFLRKAAHTYGFFLMPPMPPRPADTAARASSVRNILRYVARSTAPILGVAPEGADSPELALSTPPPGVGRFLGQLARRGMTFLPVAVYEEGRTLCIRFGTCFDIDRTAVTDRDQQIADIAMAAVADLLPPSLQGAYA